MALPIATPMLMAMPSCVHADTPTRDFPMPMATPMAMPRFIPMPLPVPRLVPMPMAIPMAVSMSIHMVEKQEEERCMKCYQQWVIITRITEISKNKV